jgi:hypothetical protein
MKPCVISKLITTDKEFRSLKSTIETPYFLRQIAENNNLPLSDSLEGLCILDTEPDELMLKAAYIGDFTVFKKALDELIRRLDQFTSDYRGRGYLDNYHEMKIILEDQIINAAIVAIDRVHFEIVNYIVYKISRSSMQFVKQSVLEYIFEDKNIEILDYLILNGKSEGALVGLLKLAIMYGNINIVNHIVNADPIKRTPTVYNLPLSLASGNGNLEIVKIFLEHGANNYDDAIDYAEERGYPDIADYIRNWRNIK